MALGSFKLEGLDALALGRLLQYSKGLDPSLAVYAAYAYHDLQRRDLLRQMSSYMQADLGASLFDVALLARSLDQRTTDRRTSAPQLLGAVPLISQGWALLRAFGVELFAPLAQLEAMRLPSLWTMFDARGVRRIRSAFSSGELL
jgi:hypothetical protein